jgi:hypothetical protein
MTEENNPFKKERKTEDWPAEVIERLSMQAERTGESLEKVQEAFIKHLADTHACDDWAAEDEDLLIDWAESFIIMDRRSSVSGGGADTTTFVGTFVGVDAKSSDRRVNIVRRRRQMWENDSNEAMSSGMVGHYMKEGDSWVINTTNGVIETNESVENIPSMGFKAGNDYICLLSKAGRPYPHKSVGRHYYFLGNEQSIFVNDGSVQLWRVDCTDDNMDHEVKVGIPCRIQVRLPTTTLDAFKDILNTNMNFWNTVEYTDEFVDEGVKKFLNPFLFWTNDEFVGDMFVDLENLSEAYSAGVRTFEGSDGRQGRVGPIIFTKGIVNRMSTEGRESEYDESGMSYSLSLTTAKLQNIHGTGMGSDVTVWISGACNNLAHPFSFEDDDGERWPYAEKTPVLVCGRLAMSMRDGQEVPNIKGMGVYTSKKRARRGERGGNTGPSQFM